MANVLNRSQYGNLSCLWGVFKANFSEVGDDLALSDLKVNNDQSNNPLEFCPGGEEFPESLSERLGRDRYCPFLKSRTDERICQWVHSKEHDPQKSKPVGQTAIALDIAGLAKLNTTKSGRTKSLTWLDNALKVNKMEWGSDELNEYFINNILGYGPILGLSYYLNERDTPKVKSSDIKSNLMIKPTNDIVEVMCENGTKTIVETWDGNTSPDASARTTSALLSLASSVGLVKPKGFSLNNDLLNPTNVSNWLNERAKNGKRTFPRTYYIENENVAKVLNGGIEVERGINYKNFIPKPSDRNKGNRCECCKANVINMARKDYGNISRNRKMLLIEGLRKAANNDSLLDLKILSDRSCDYDSFYFNEDSQYNTLLNIERLNIIFYGFPNTVIGGHKLKPLIKAKENAFGEPPAFVKIKIDEILNDEVFLKR